MTNDDSSHKQTASHADQFKSFSKTPNGNTLRKLSRNEKWAFLHPTPLTLELTPPCMERPLPLL